MKYLSKTFTLPTANNVSQVKWDLAFLTTEEFARKYKGLETPQEGNQ